MLSNKELNFFCSLKYKKNWLTAPVFMVEGRHIIEELLNSSLNIEYIFVDKTSFLLYEKHTKITKIIETKILHSISRYNSPSSEIAIVQKPHWEFPENIANLWSLFLDNIQDPGNVGTIIRIADWFGISHVFLGPGCAHWFNPKALQSSMGSFSRVKIFSCELSYLKNKFPEIPIIGASLNGKNLFQEVHSLKPGILVIGNEGQGISDDNKNFIQQNITIPKFGGAESLNAAVACGIILATLTNQVN
ncbi:MAG: RNA methyltransferase [Sediminibacterium sp.]|nr:RNA methyltransferase [Sediminibacterium sp.]